MAAGQTGPQGGGILLEHLKAIQVELPAVKTTTFTTAGFDASFFNWIDWMVNLGVLGADHTLDLQVQHSDLIGSGFADLAATTQVSTKTTVAPAQITIADNNSVIHFATDLRLSKDFLRLVATVAGTGPSIPVGIVGGLNGEVREAPVV